MYVGAASITFSNKHCMSHVVENMGSVNFAKCIPTVFARLPKCLIIYAFFSFKNCNAKHNSNMLLISIDKYVNCNYIDHKHLPRNQQKYMELKIKIQL